MTNQVSMTHQYDPLVIRDLGHYYSYDDELYDNHFPKEYALSHKPLTGPKNCKLCAKYGHWRGVFIGYCVKCAIVHYKQTRGNGFLMPGIEFCVQSDTSSFNTYLKGVPLNDIGDYYMNPNDIITYYK
jgi:hypothetical protein